jgi:hypothetical protein
MPATQSRYVRRAAFSSISRKADGTRVKVLHDKATTVRIHGEEGGVQELARPFPLFAQRGEDVAGEFNPSNTAVLPVEQIDWPLFAGRNIHNRTEGGGKGVVGNSGNQSRTIVFHRWFGALPRCDTDRQTQ